MSKVPSLPYPKIIIALEPDGWVVVRQRGSHIRLEKQLARDLSTQAELFTHHPEPETRYIKGLRV